MTSKEESEKVFIDNLKNVLEIEKENVHKETMKQIKLYLEVLDIFKKHLIIEIDDEPFSDKYHDNSYLVNLKETDEDFYFTSIYVTEKEKELLERWLKGE